MKKYIITLVAGLFLIPALTFGQTKFGHLAKQELLAKMPATAEAKKKLESFGKQLEEQQTELKKELETKYQAYMTLRESPTANKTILSSKEEEIKSLNERLQKFQVTANEDFQKEQESTMRPIIERVDMAIKEVAKEGKYGYIFDTSLGVVIYAQEGDDISTLVQKKLDSMPSMEVKQDGAKPAPGNGMSPRPTNGGGMKRK
jgi:outer membrane protein